MIHPACVSKPISCRCSSVASFSFCCSFSRASIGNQSFMKLSKAQSTLAVHGGVVSSRTAKSIVIRTAVRGENGRRTAHRTIALSALLHLDEAAHAEEVAALEADRLERDARADHARVVVDVRDDGQQRLAEGLHEQQREGRARLRRQRDERGGRAAAVWRERRARDCKALGERRRDGQRGALGVFLEDLARRLRGGELKLETKSVNAA